MYNVCDYTRILMSAVTTCGAGAEAVLFLLRVTFRGGGFYAIRYSFYSVNDKKIFTKVH